MTKKLFDGTGHWYRGNLHSHTTNSDGRMTPEEAVHAYQAQGYSFLCLTDHDVFSDQSQAFSQDGFLLLPGIERSAILFDQEGRCLKQHHMNGIQFHPHPNSYRHGEKTPPIIRYDQWDGAEVLRQMSQELRAHGCFTTYNHPVWSRVEPEEYQFPELFDALEIYNFNTVNESATGCCTAAWENMLRKGMRVRAVASDDNHNGSFPDCFGGFIMVWAKELTPAALEEALLSGSYYSSSGPSIHQIEMDETTIHVACGPAERINFLVGGEVGSGTTILSDGQNLLTQGSYRFRATDTYVRVECVDQTGKKAWSNPIFLK